MAERAVRSGHGDGDDDCGLSAGERETVTDISEAFAVAFAIVAVYCSCVSEPPEGLSLKCSRYAAECKTAVAEL